ncbi:hypothetical protein [uncultured Cohaesibacter sp.]|uniref:hypothetical protein n=1 Tax=uncultured Cohaesibacter sp. TaxID=1002546 RepID=UPI0029C6BF25|nr:hypothetical protein [uncultured Cohaesibacter sp.]
MKSVTRLFAAAALLAFAGAASAHMDKPVTPAQTDAKAATSVVAEAKPCEGKMVRDKDGRVHYAGCAGIAMPCMTNSDCCSNNCDNSACNQ